MVDNLAEIKQLAESGDWQLRVPTTVLVELEGLSKSQESRDPERDNRDEVRDKLPARKTAGSLRKAKRYAEDFAERAAVCARVKKSRVLKAERGAKLVIPKSARADRAGV